MVERSAPSLRVRSVFISDVHLGFKGCSAELLLDFLHHVEMDNLFLVGDIVDVWSMKKTMYWPQSHNNVLRTILGKAKRGTKVIFVPGNHDEVFRDFDGAVFGNLEIHSRIHARGADGRRMLVLHGDEFDSVVKCSPWLAKLGSSIYDVLLAANPYINWVRRQVRAAALVAVVVFEGQGEEGRAIHRQLRGVRGAGRAQARRRHGRLRAHSSRRDSRHQRHLVLQRRRLGRELHIARRGHERSSAAHRLAGTARAAAGRDRADSGRGGGVSDILEMWSRPWHALQRSLADDIAGRRAPTRQARRPPLGRRVANGRPLSWLARGRAAAAIVSANRHIRVTGSMEDCT